MNDRDPGDEDDGLEHWEEESTPAGVGVVFDPKGQARIRDPELLRRLHFEYEECVICGDVKFSLHHVLKRSQGGDDLPENLVALCGHGTDGCHGGVEQNLDFFCSSLGLYVQSERPDIIAYIERKLRTPEAAEAWLKRHLRIVS